MSDQANKPAGQALAQGIAAIGTQQLFARIIPFFLNMLSNNYLSPEDTALESVKFHLLTAIVYSVGREGFRRGCLRGRTASQVFRSACTLWPIWLLITTVTCAAFSFQKPLSAKGILQPGYHAALMNYWLACVIEGAIEPFYILGTFNCSSVLEVVSEVCGRVVGSSVFAASVLLPQVRSAAAVAYSRGQLAYALVMALCYIGHAIRNLKYFRRVIFNESEPLSKAEAETGGASDSIKPTEGDKASASAVGQVVPDATTDCPERVVAFAKAIGGSPQAIWLSLVFGWQAVQKMLLQEASRFATNGYNAHVAGVYGGVQNLGSLVVRIIFWPIESSAFRAFSRLQSGNSSPQKHGNTDHGLHLLSILTRVVVLVALIACAFGPNYAFSVIHILLSATWSKTEAPAVLSLYCFYLLFLAVNGVLEAYVHATLGGKGLRNANAVMVAVTILHVGVIWGSRFIAEDCMFLVLADCLNMGVRIAYSTWCIFQKHRGQSFGGASAWTPSFASLVTLGAASLATRYSNVHMLQLIGDDAKALDRLPVAMVWHIGRGVACCLSTLAALWFTERKLRRAVAASLKEGTD